MARLHRRRLVNEQTTRFDREKNRRRIADRDKRKSLIREALKEYGGPLAAYSKLRQGNPSITLEEVNGIYFQQEQMRAARNRS